MSKTNKKSLLLVVWLALLGGLLFGITHFSGGTNGTGNAQTTPPPTAVPEMAAVTRRWPEVVSHAAAPPRGRPDAPYTIAEFGDFQCPQCGKSRPVIEQLLAKYPNQVNLIFVHRPFPSIHHYALAAAEASEIAANQGRFWPMYDELYSHQDDLEPGFYGDYAQAVGLNKAQFNAAMDAHVGQAAVDAASKFSDSLGVEETPTLLLRDNVHGTVTAYVGRTGKDNRPGVPGIDDLAANPPWLAKH